MPRYRYLHFEATCYNVRQFRVDQMREAVDYLKTQPQTKYAGLCAKCDYKSPTHRFWLGTKPLIQLEKVKGKTPREVWEMFDADVTRQIKYFENRW